MKDHVTKSLLFLSLVGSSGCDSPTSPTCDILGRGPVPYLQVLCSAAGPDVQCRGIRAETGYCAGPGRDATAEGVWVSSDPTVSGVTAPGYYKTIGAGEVLITFSLEFLSMDPIPFTVAPNMTAERMVNLSVIAEDQSNNARIPGVTAEVVPSRGRRQTCVTNGTGFCGARILEGPVTVTGTKAGYEDVVASPDRPPSSFIQPVMLRMRRVSP
jgi:hypothetical protein